MIKVYYESPLCGSPESDWPDRPHMTNISGRIKAVQPGSKLPCSPRGALIRCCPKPGQTHLSHMDISGQPLPLPYADRLAVMRTVPTFIMYTV